MQTQDTARKRSAPQKVRIRVVFRITREILVKRLEATGFIQDEDESIDQQSVLMRSGGLESLLRVTGNERCEVTVECDLNPNTSRNPTTVWYADYVHVGRNDLLEVVLVNPYKILEEEFAQLVETACPINKKQLTLDLIADDVIENPFSEDGRKKFEDALSAIQLNRDEQSAQFLLEFFRKHRPECIAGLQELKNRKPEPEPEPEPPVAPLGTGNVMAEAFKLAEAKKNGNGHENGNGHKPADNTPVEPPAKKTARKRAAATK